MELTIAQASSFFFQVSSRHLTLIPDLYVDRNRHLTLIPDLHVDRSREDRWEHQDCRDATKARDVYFEDITLSGISLF